jgi:hypothetical protein
MPCLALTRFLSLQFRTPLKKTTLSRQAAKSPSGLRILLGDLAAWREAFCRGVNLENMMRQEAIL